MKTLQDKFAKELSKNECWDSDGFECYFNLMNGSKAVTILHLQEMMGFPTDWTLLPFLSGEQKASKPEETQ